MCEYLRPVVALEWLKADTTQVTGDHYCCTMSHYSGHINLSSHFINHTLTELGSVSLSIPQLRYPIAIVWVSRCMEYVSMGTEHKVQCMDCISVQCIVSEM